jgi:DNA-binding MarR family transcriptional regulator
VLVPLSESPEGVLRVRDLGRAAIEEAAPKHVEATRAYFIDLLSDEEIDVLTEVCDRVLAKLAGR